MWQGVGKSSAVTLMCHNQPINNPTWTIGCSIEVKLHEFREGTPSQKTYFVELWDIGGSSSHSNTRSVFYNAFHGVILVHDLTNRKSHENLRKWLAEILCRESPSRKGFDFDQEMFADSPVPLLLVATKSDLVQDFGDTSERSFAASLAQQCGADHIFLDTHNAKSLAPGSSNAVKLSRFFDKVIEKRFCSQGVNTYTTFTDRRRIVPPPKYSHVD
ncbi:rab-like protein 3 isoform X2 [Ornithodoros turicata]|uniref:rab-like protein 3 isoform X2 n=1 Tax=Ornithodoros turicata TaxID=34597 RepID=UPI003139EFEC